MSGQFLKFLLEVSVNLCILEKHRLHVRHTLALSVASAAAACQAAAIVLWQQVSKDTALVIYPRYEWHFADLVMPLLAEFLQFFDKLVRNNISFGGKMAFPHFLLQ